MSQMSQSRAKQAWKILVILGISGTSIGLGALGFDFATIGQFAFISDNYEVSLLAILVGAGLLLVSLIGWAACLGRIGRTRIAFFTLTVPLGVILIGYALGGTNVHGPFYYFLLPMVPLILVGLVVAIMAASAQKA
ncbi:MAG TPA: hypothetical protein VFB43_09255 [Terracidiphilus sp.]|nr:hypothetical protein [Terracidiphilus sp.]